MLRNMRLGIQLALTTVIFSVFNPGLLTAARSSQSLATFEEVRSAAEEGKELTLVLDWDDAGCSSLDLLDLSVAVLDMKQYRFDTSEELGRTLSVSTSYLADRTGTKDPEHPSILVLVDFELSEQSESEVDAALTMTNVDVSNGWTVLGTRTAECSFNAGVKIFSQTDETNPPPEALADLNAVNDAFFTDGRSISGYLDLDECEDALGTGNWQTNTRRIHFKPVFGTMETSDGAPNLLEVTPYVARISDGGEDRFEIRSTVVQVLSDRSVVAFLTSRDPRSWDLTNEEVYICSIADSSAAIFARTESTPTPPTADAGPKTLVSDFTAIENALRSGSDVRLHINGSACTLPGGGEPADEWPGVLAVGPLPYWELIPGLVPAADSIKFAYASTEDFFGNTGITMYTFRAFEILGEMRLVVSASTHDPLTGEEQEPSPLPMTCNLDGQIAGFSIVSSDQVKLDNFQATVQSMTTTGKIFSSVTDLDPCGTPRAAFGSNYDANFVFVESASTPERKYIFSPMQTFMLGGDGLGLVVQDSPMSTFDNGSVVTFKRSVLAFPSLDPIQQEEVSCPWTEDAATNAVSVFA